MKRRTAVLRTLALAGAVPVLAACGGGGHLSVESREGREVTSSELVFPPGRAVEFRLPVRIAGGVPPYEYGIEGCPGWVTLFPDQRILAGTAPVAARGQTFFCTYRVTESDPGFRPPRSVAHGLRIRVPTVTAPDLALPLPGKVEFSVGTFRDVELPPATGGVAPYSYSFSCAGGALPPGMGFAPATRRLAGTPAARFRDSCTYSATDSSATAATVSTAVEVEVGGPAAGPLTLPLPGRVDLSVGTFRDVLLPPATGGVEPYAYTFACAGGSLPSGMSFAPATRRLAGTPGTRFRDSCIYSATDSASPPATVSRAVEIEVAGPVTGTLTLPRPGRVNLSVGRFDDRLLPAATGGVEPYAYTFACAGGSLPPGMSFAPATRRLAGTPGTRFRDSCTYSVTDSASPPAMVSRAVEVEVGGPVTGTLTLPLPPGVDLSVGEFDDVELPPAMDGVEPYVYSFACAGGSLPPGMSFAPATRRLAGTPETLFRDSCTYSVMDSAVPAATVSQPVEIEVAGPAVPLSLDELSKVSLAVGAPYNQPFPPAMGGVGPYTYSFTCGGGALPSGVSFTPATRRLAGTPESRFRDSCTYSVTDSALPAATVSRPVEIEVGGPLAGPLSLPTSVVPGNVLRLRVGERARVTFRPATGGVRPYTYELHCPDPPPGTFPGPSTLPPGLGFGPRTLVLSGTPETAYTGPDCTYRVTDSAIPPATDAESVALIVDPARAKWRFAPRSLAQQDAPLMRDSEVGSQVVYELPGATVEEDPQPSDTAPVYRLLGIGPPLSFDPVSDSRELGYEHPCDSDVCDPRLGRTATYRYQVLFGDTVDDTLCVDVGFRDEDEDDPDDQLIASVRIRDDAYFNGSQYVCPAPPLLPSSASLSATSNPVHEALGPVHARRALDAAHGAVRDRVRAWRPGGRRVLTAFTPAVGVGSLSGESEGFAYSGSSESATAGAELGSGAWQAGLLASFTRTELRYRADARLAGQGYRAGDHDTEIFSLHPFAAWHMPSGGDVWASLGAGTGRLRHRDELGFPSWSRSDVRLRAYAAGASVPVAEVLSGEVEAEAGVEGFALEIEGGDRISTSLPTLRGRDWRAGLSWSAPVGGAPSLSMAYRHLTGDGPGGGRLETKGSASIDGVLDPRLSLIANVEGALGLGGHDHESWGLSGGVRFAPGEERRGLGVELDTRLASSGDGSASGAGIRGEAGYGLSSGNETIRPWVGLVRYPADGSFRRSVGVDLRDTPGSKIALEYYERPRHRSRGVGFSLRHRF